MEKDKSANQIGNSSLPPSGRYSLFSPPGIGKNVKPDHSAGLALPPLGPGVNSESSLFSHGLPSDSSLFSHDISRMTDNPMKKSGHRRAHSEILTLPDDISFDSDLGVVGGLDGPSLSDEAEDDLLSMYLDMDYNSMSATSSFELGGPSSSAPSESTPTAAEKPAPLSSERPRVRHQHSQSLDGSTSIKQLMGSGTEETSSSDARKATSAAKLSELAITDPKRAKRVWANRQSAARSKERKMRYISELERKVQAMQTEATSLSAQLALLQRDTNGLTAENSELKLHLQTMEQQVNLQDALNESLREEMQHLKVMTSQAIQNGGPMNFLSSSSYGSGNHQQQQQFYNNNHAMQTLLTAQQLQQLQINQQSQHHQFQQQQQQQQFQQQQHSQQQQLADMKMRGSGGPSSMGQREKGSDPNMSSNE